MLPLVRLTDGLASTGYPGMNRPRIGHLDSGQPVVFKANRDGWMDDTPFGTGAEQDRAEVLASHLLVDVLGLEGLPSYPARSSEGNVGTYTHLVEGMKTYAECSLDKIANPDSAVAQLVARDWLGDWDANATNFGVTPDGRLVSFDFGGAMMRGLPVVRRRAYTEIMDAYGTPERVGPICSKILALSDSQIDAAVTRVGRSLVPDWSSELREHYTSVLIHNREAIREHYAAARTGLATALALAHAA
ncbi:MAG: hypothetical protein AB1758_15720 [Candidatus Eremiobacterota bacterium]